MPVSAYERYGLVSNPFRDLASENLEDVGIFHVNLAVDDQIGSIEEEVLDKENRALVAIVGGPGTGKTQRLLLAAGQGKERKAMVAYVDVTGKSSLLLEDVTREIQKQAAAAGFAKTFSSPKWYRDLTALQKIKDGQYDPVAAGKTIGEALSGAAPAFLLLNDVHNLSQTPEADVFGKLLQEISDAIKPGVLVMFCCYTSYLIWLVKNRPALASRINRAISLPRLNAEEASLLIAKKLLAKRLVENLDPTYPFDREAVAELNSRAGGNPRRLLDMADLALEYAAQHRRNRVDSETVRAALLAGEPASPAGPPVTTAPKPPEATAASDSLRPAPELR